MRPIAELSEGEIGRVLGTVRPAGRPLKAPLTGRECVCYVTAIAYGDYQIRAESRGVPFLLEDASGLAVVDPSRAELAIDFDHEDRAGASSQRMTYREAIISAGETIYVAGAGARVPGSGDPYRAGWPAPLRLGAPPELRCLIGRARVR